MGGFIPLPRIQGDNPEVYILYMFKYEISNNTLFVVSVRMVPLCVCRYYRAAKRQMILSQMGHYDEEEREKMKHWEPLGYATFSFFHFQNIFLVFSSVYCGM